MKAETRRLILEAAFVLFEERGYEQTTMRQLAAQAKVGLGTIFQHFPDKPSLLRAAFNEELTLIFRQGMATLPPGDLRLQTRHMLAPALAFYAARPELGRVLLKEGLFAAGDCGRDILANELALSEHMVALIQAAVSRGELRPQVDARRLAEAMWAYYFFVLSVGLRGGDCRAEAMLEQAMALVDQVWVGVGA